MRMRNKKGGIFYMIAHYTKPAHFLDYIHPIGHFRISSFSKSNDPYEYKQRIFGLNDVYNPDDFSEKNFGEKINQTVQLPKEATSVILQKIKFDSFVNDSQNSSDIMQATFWNNAPLWAHRTLTPPSRVNGETGKYAFYLYAIFINNLIL